MSGPDKHAHAFAVSWCYYYLTEGVAAMHTTANRQARWPRAVTYKQTGPWCNASWQDKRWPGLLCLQRQNTNTAFARPETLLRSPPACLVHAAKHQQPPAQACGCAVLALTGQLCPQGLPGAPLRVIHLHSPATNSRQHTAGVLSRCCCEVPFHHSCVAIEVWFKSIPSAQ